MSDFLDLCASDPLQLCSEYFLGIGAIIVFTCVGLWNAVKTTEAGAAPTGEIGEGEFLVTGRALGLGGAD
jgi:hypothetical protein